MDGTSTRPTLSYRGRWRVSYDGLAAGIAPLNIRTGGNTVLYIMYLVIKSNGKRVEGVGGSNLLGVGFRVAAM